MRGGVDRKWWRWRKFGRNRDLALNSRSWWCDRVEKTGESVTWTRRDIIKRLQLLRTERAIVFLHHSNQGSFLMCHRWTAELWDDMQDAVWSLVLNYFVNQSRQTFNILRYLILRFAYHLYQCLSFACHFQLTVWTSSSLLIWRQSSSHIIRSLSCWTLIWTFHQRLHWSWYHDQSWSCNRLKRSCDFAWFVPSLNLAIYRYAQLVTMSNTS